MGRLSCVAAVFVVLVAGIVSSAAAECPAYPKNDYWENLNHDTTRRYVNLKYGGDWVPYIDKWQGQLIATQNIFKSGKDAVMARTGIRLSGEKLHAYIEDIKARIKVIQCLAKEAKAGKRTTAVQPQAEATGVIDPDTETAPQAPQRRPEFGAAIELPGAVRLEAAVRCETEDTVFSVVNRGGIWPEVAALAVIDVQAKVPLARRSIRMGDGQTVSFRIKGGAPMELVIAAPWTNAERRLVTARCE